ncbi:aldolase/citrate lyase family protein [Streptomyces angustmyceticus]|uniref:Siderophore biosynthesis protein SbnG n=1 Tax=Streptomyces angustmyceticus TaxID=285578 RepID=A0A5J4LL75_9ACTN|nr:aldolase/citrate lyase family protein [Streptomyces angustmyceticus]UAL70404.1 siderophore biosynthesis protein SbnG [Streptomyces angustmyceticus]GES33254.1 siderophore biosynthesis protein SbnG [Streptomyces angustmyceticus]
MLRPNEVRHRLAAGEEAYGLFSTLPEPAMVEMIGCADYDFVILDTEHTLVDPQRLENLIRAAETTGLTPFVRVPEADPGAVLRALDAGAMGIVVPHVRGRADIDATIRAARYAPEGMRSLNGGRGPGFGRIDPAEYLRRANAEIMIVALLEDREGVEAIDEILAPGGVDLVLPGPGDLSQSYGVPWQVRHPRIQEAVRALRDACARHDVPFCAMSTTPERRAQWHADGVRAFVLGEDRDLTARALREHRQRTAGQG